MDSSFCQQCAAQRYWRFEPIVDVTMVELPNSPDPYELRVWCKCPVCGTKLIGYISSFRDKDYAQDMRLRMVGLKTGD